MFIRRSMRCATDEPGVKVLKLTTIKNLRIAGPTIRCWNLFTETGVGGRREPAPKRSGLPKPK
jgi:hypothetical protein